jgi:prevent-host-death family protein
MAITTFTSREFNQFAGEAKKASRAGPVFITSRGTPSHVLLSIDDYRQLSGGVTTLAQALAQQDGPEFEFAAPHARGFARVAELP